MSVRGPRLLHIVHPTQHIRTAIIPCPNYSPLRSWLPSPPHSQPIRFLTRTALLRTPPPPPHPRSNDRGPVSDEDTQTDFSTLDVLANSPPPATAVDACLPDGFHLSNGLKIGGGSGCLLVGGEAFEWRPWDVSRSPWPMINGKGQWDVAKEAWALLEVVWPKPDLLILGIGPSIIPISPETRQQINTLGIRVEVQDTRNAAAQFNLLATERGVGDVAAALIPIGRKEIKR